MNLNHALIKIYTPKKQKASPLPARFSPVTPTNVGIGLQNVLIFTFNSFATLVQNLKAIIKCQSKIAKVEPRAPFSKNVFPGQIRIKFRL